MADLVFNGFKSACLGTPTSGTPAATISVTADTLKVLLLGTGTPYTPDPDHRFVASVAASELAVTGYTGGFGGGGRKTLAARTLVTDDTNDRGVFDAADVTWNALSTGDTIAYVVLFKELVSDALSPLIALFDITDTPTNGGDIVIQWNNPAGLITLT